LCHKKETMTHTYNISGMTCSGCQAKVQSLLAQVEGVTNVSIDLAKGQAEIGMSNHINTDILKYSLKDYPKYQLSEAISAAPTSFGEGEESKSWFQIYKPILLIFAYLTGVSILIAWNGNGYNLHRLMQVFMASFFLVFSFFKLLDLKGFAESYAMYDVVAKKIPQWGYLYPFVELALGISYILYLNPLVINIATLVIMSVSIIGVLQSVLNKRKIKCACLGAVFNLPMSTVTIIEDGLMIIMSGFMLFSL
jgi:copper chaperone CopZ